MFGRKKPITDINKYFKKVAERAGGPQMGGKSWARQQIMNVFVRDVVDTMQSGADVSLAQSLFSALQHVDRQVAARANRVGGLTGASRGKPLMTDIDLEDTATQAVAGKIFEKHAQRSMIASLVGKEFGGLNRGGNFKKYIAEQNRQRVLVAPTAPRQIGYTPIS